MKVILFGSNGMLGSYIKSYFMYKNLNIICLTRADIDISIANHKHLENKLKECEINKDTIIINAAGLIPQASAQRTIHNYDYIKVNSIFPSILSTISSKYDSKLIHITTDCVFSGSKGSYNENDDHDTTDMYGVSKSLGENIDCTIIRTSIIGEEINNKRSLLEWVIKNKNGKINGYKNHIWNGVTCLQLAKIIFNIIKNNKYWIGVRHVFSPFSVSKYDLVSFINKTYNLNIIIDEYDCDKKIDKSLTSVYKDLLLDIPSIETQIESQYRFELI